MILLKKLLPLCLISLMLSGCFLAASGYNKTKVENIKPEEKERLDSFLRQLDLCYKREIQRVDDNVSALRDISEVVLNNCKGYFNNIKMTLYKEFGVGLGYAYSFSENLQKSAPTIITEGILAKRRLHNQSNPQHQLLKRTY